MKKSLLFLPDISGFTHFVQNTEVEHSQHVIAELLEILIEANTLGLVLAEIEGDALFFYKEEELPSLDDIMTQIETMYTAFYTHLRRLEKHRICPCNACAMAPELELKIIAHSGEIQFITVHDQRKPFGTQVIEAHRLMKNTVPSDNYVLLSEDLCQEINLQAGTHSEQYEFLEAKNHYDGRDVCYLYATINPDNLDINALPGAYSVDISGEPQLLNTVELPVAAEFLFEYISNFRYRHLWNQDADGFEYNEQEVTRLGSSHICVVNGQHLDFVTVTKEAKAGQLVYGEKTSSPPPLDELYQFFIITPLDEGHCRLDIETYWKAHSPLKKLAMALLVKRALRNSLESLIDRLSKQMQAHSSGVKELMN